MAKYRCKICGYIYDEEKENIKFDELTNDYTCEMCKVPKYLFEKIDDEIVEEKEENLNSIMIADDNPSIEKIVENCINCGMCLNICKQRQGINDLCNGKACVNCGQCIQFCPTGALIPKQDKNKFYKAKNEGKILVAYISPAVRVSIGDEFNMKKGEYAQGKLISALRKLGFDYVFDVTFAADLTIMEEANELMDRLQNNKTLPMFTSCCSSWIKYAESFYPELLPNISTCKSPIGMMGEIVKKYFSKKNKIKENDIYTIAITPCTSKKYEIKREEITGTDLVLTVRELSDILKYEKIDLSKLENGRYDSIFSEGSGAGIIFGNTGGVMEASIREIYYILTGKLLKKIEFHKVRGMENIKEASIKINGLKLNVAVVHKMSKAIPILEDVKNGISKYHYIEIMNCEGGCIGGGGQPKFKPGNEKRVKEKRIKSLYKRDKKKTIRYPHDNPDVKRVYNEFLGEPLGIKSQELLHTKYEDKSKLLEKIKEASK